MRGNRPNRYTTAPTRLAAACTPNHKNDSVTAASSGTPAAARNRAVPASRTPMPLMLGNSVRSVTIGTATP